MRVGSRIRAGYLALLVVLFAAPCAAPPCKAASGTEIEAEVRATLDEFFRKVGFAHALGNRAVAILVFPTVVKAGFGIGECIAGRARRLVAQSKTGKASRADSTGDAARVP
jgi:hypothetical protein